MATSQRPGLAWVREVVCLALNITTNVFDETSASSPSNANLEGFLYKPETAQTIVFFIQTTKTADELAMSKATTGRLIITNGQVPTSLDETETLLFMNRKTNDNITDIESSENLYAEMAKVVHYGTIQGDMLLMLSSIITEVVVPSMRVELAEILGKSMGTSGESQSEAEMGFANKLGVSYGKKGALGGSIGAYGDPRLEFAIQSQKFSSQLEATRKQLLSDFTIIVPPIQKEADPQLLATDRILCDKFEEAVQSWIPTCNSILEEAEKMNSTGRHPIDEIELWRSRSLLLGGLYEQLCSNDVKVIIKTLEINRTCAAVTNFLYKKNQITKITLEARDNVKFLSTLERHFKTLTTSSLFTIADTIPSLYTGFSMVWIISRHFNTDERMAPLLEKTADLISKRIEETLNTTFLYTQNIKDVLEMVGAAKRCCQNWKESYFNTRTSLEKSGRNKRWEFNRLLLFGSTEFMFGRCLEIEETLNTLDEFTSLAGASLQTIAGDARGFKNLTDRIKLLPKPLLNANDWIWDPNKIAEWGQAIQEFKKNVKLCKKVAYNYIDQSFSQLSSVESTLHLILQFQEVDTNNASIITTHMLNKLETILDQYLKEIVDVRAMFDAQKENPKIEQNVPPTAGKILWARQLFIKIKEPYKLIQRLPEELKNSKVGHDVMAKVKYLGEDMRSYEERIFNRWGEEAENIVMKGLRSPLFTEGTKRNAAEIIDRINKIYERKNMITKEKEVTDKMNKQIGRRNKGEGQEDESLSDFENSTSSGEEEDQDEDFKDAKVYGGTSATARAGAKPAAGTNVFDGSCGDVLNMAVNPNDWAHVPNSDDIILKTSAQFKKLFRTYKNEPDHLPMLQQEQDLTGSVYSFFTVSDLFSNKSNEPCVNFTGELQQLIDEAKVLNKLGFSISDTILNVVLQERKFKNYSDGLEQILEQIKENLSSVTKLEKSMLTSPIKKLSVILRPGFGPLNWNSLATQDFIAVAADAVNEFSQVINQIKKITTSIQNSITLISRVDLIPSERIMELGSRNTRDGQNAKLATKNALLTLTDRQAAAVANAMQAARKRAEKMRLEAEAAERGRTMLVNMVTPITYKFDDILTLDELNMILKVVRESELIGVLEKYRTIPPLITKVEEILYGSNTRERPEMKEYYKFWESQLITAIIKMIIQSLNSFLKLLNISDSMLLDDENMGGRTQSNMAQKGNLFGGLSNLDESEDAIQPAPVFRVSASLASPEIIISPSVPYIQNTLSNIIQAILDSSILFMKWKPDTCMESKYVPLEADVSGQLQELGKSYGKAAMIASPDQLKVYFKSISSDNSGGEGGSGDAKSSGMGLKVSSKDASGIHEKGSNVINDREVIVINNYHQITNGQSVANTRFKCNKAIQRCITNLQRYFQQFSEFEDIWKSNRSTNLIKFSQNKPDIVDYDIYISKYQELYDNFQLAAQNRPDSIFKPINQIDFMLVNSNMLIISVISEAKYWIQSIGHIISSQARPLLLAVSGEIDTLIKVMLQKPDTLEMFQSVMLAIQQSQLLTMDMDLKIAPIVDMYSILKRHSYLKRDPESFVRCSLDITPYNSDIMKLLRSYDLGMSSDSLSKLFDLVEKEKMNSEMKKDNKLTDSMFGNLKIKTISTKSQSASAQNNQVAVTDPVVVVTASELKAAMGLNGRWVTVQNMGKEIERLLEKTKEKFMQITQQNSESFYKQVKEFIEEMKTMGPEVYLIPPDESEEKEEQQNKQEGKKDDEGSSNGLKEEEDKQKKEKVEFKPNIRAAAEVYVVMNKPLKDLAVKRDEIQHAQRLFKMEETTYEELTRIERKMSQLGQIFEVYEEIQSTIKSWEDMLFKALDVKSIESGLEKLTYKLNRLNKDLKTHPAFIEIAKILEEFKQSIPLFLDLRSDALRPRHWMQVAEITGGSLAFEIDSINQLTLGQLIQMNLYQFSSEINTITSAAQKELAIEKGLREISEMWKKINFPLVMYKNSRGVNRTYILKSIDEIMQNLEDNTMNLQSMSSSPFVKPFQEEVRTWEKKLSVVSDVCEEWLSCQRQWLYLESIFIGSDDIRMQLPDEAKKFDNVDRSFVKLMTETGKNTNVMEVCNVAGRLALIESLKYQMEACQKSLTEYLNSKRSAFPRFYFISDDELLSVLGTSDPEAIQDHIMKMFDSAHSLTFVKPGNSVQVKSMVSGLGEVLELHNPVQVEGPIESWMKNVEVMMRTSVRKVLKKGTFEYGHQERGDWIRTHHGQVTLATSKIWWTWFIEDAFKKVKTGNAQAMKQLASRLGDQINGLVEMVRSNLDRHTRKKVNTLIIIDVHSRDIVERFVRDSILDEDEFDWESQLRFYWDRDADECLIRQSTGVYSYSYEYTGLSTRLVITPLTDRCVMTLTQAMRLCLGGSPAGPAGTGKTETVKDLAKHLAKMCQVVNCSEGIDYKAMGAIFCGVCENGCFACFDEFNRIEASVLSVISAQIKQIQQALQQKLTKFIFEGREIILGSSTAIFITMNPGYAGRTELPDNLKALFRPVSMIKPDNLLICENMLFSEGFNGAKALAKKMTVLYKLSSEQLSKQYHYDFGLRALKSVLVMAGQLKRNNPEHNEQAVLMRALRDMNLPKFIFEDVPLFLGLIADLFPGLDCPRQRYEDLTIAVRKASEKVGNEVLEDQVDKCVQMYETLLARHSVMIVGPTGGGKTVVLETLRDALTSMGSKTRYYTINPKAQTVAELYGVLNPDTREWTDGLLSNIFRKINQPLPPERKSERHYIVFDGDVDAEWIETMNSVMDDNKLLTLTNGERIYLQDHCKLIFEVSDLQYASPATISRCGMVWVDKKNLGYKPFFDRWMRGKIVKQRETLLQMFSKYVIPLVERVIEGIKDGEVLKPMKQILPRTNLNLVRQLTVAFDCILIEGQRSFDRQKAAGKNQALVDFVDPDTMAVTSGDIIEVSDPAVIEAIFIFACVIGIGSTLVESEREEFDLMLKELSLMPTVETEGALVAPGQLPAAESTLFEYSFDPSQSCWVPWSSSIVQYVPPPDNRFSSILVPTIDTVRNAWILNTFAKNSHPVLFVGSSGTAKTTCIQAFIRSLSNKTYSNLLINFSSRTTALDVQRAVEDNVEKRIKGIYGPPSGKKLIVFIDELNMPNIDKYGTQEPITLLKLVLDKGGFYDRNPKILTWKKLIDIFFMGAMCPPGGGKNSVDPRFISHFNCFTVPLPSEASISIIYESILSRHLDIFQPTIKQLVKSITSATIELYTNIIEALPPTPAKFHYIFNMRDLNRVFEVLNISTPEIYTTPEEFVRLWKNEATRVFCDRMNTVEDIEYVNNQIADIVNEKFGNCNIEEINAEPVLFGDYNEADKLLEIWEDEKMAGNAQAEGGGGNGAASPSGNGGNGAKASASAEIPRLYQDLRSPEHVRSVLQAALTSYNMHHRPMDLVLFDEAINHLTRIHRVLRVPRGNALLIGVGGSGRQSLAKLASYMAGYETFEITLCRGYGETEFREDLKRLYTMLGVENKKVMFLFTDQHVVNEGFLELINGLLTSGMVPALFTEDERNGISSQVRKEAVGNGIDDTSANLWTYFVNKCRDNLHIVLCMSPDGDTLRQRCRAFPGLISSCTIDWFHPWPTDALTAVVKHFLEREKLPEEYRESIIKHIVYTHLSAIRLSEDYMRKKKRRTYASPKNYLDFIQAYKNMLNSKKAEFEAQIERLKGGVSKLEQAKEEVDKLQVLLARQKEELDSKTKSCDILLAKIEEQTRETYRKQEFANSKEKDLKIQTEEITKEKAEADAGLAEAVPIVEAAKAALQKLSKDDITEIKAFTQPPPLVQYVCECVVILKRLPDVSWKGAKAMLSNANFMTSLMTFDTDTLTAKNIARVQDDYIKKKSLTSEEMKSVSKAGSGLLEWVMAMVNFYKVDRLVAPKRKRVELAEQQLQRSEQELKDITEEIARLQQESKELSSQLVLAQKEQSDLKEQADIMQRRLDAATKLIGGLSSERDRWTHECARLKDNIVKLVGDCLLTTGFLSYSGGFTFDFRQKMVYGDWINHIVQLGIPHNEPFKIESLLTDEVAISQWMSQGLPGDELSIQNGILITCASRYPLMIDPQLQTTKWIKSREARNNLKVCTFNDSDFLKHLELAVMYGQPFLFENVEEIDPVIDGILERDIRRDGNRKFIILGDREVDYDSNFRLYLTTKASNPTFSPTVFSKTSVVNHVVTEDGLEEQLLNEVVSHERNDLEEKREGLVRSMAEAKTMLKDMEDSLLLELASSKGLILDNDELINTLETTRTKALELKRKLSDMERTSKDIKAACLQYSTAADLGSSLFFAMSAMSGVDKMYEYSLEGFIGIFRKSLRESEADPMVNVRLKNIMDRVMKNVYEYTCTSMFERHKLLFSFAMTIKILSKKGDINEEEYDFLLRGNTSLERLKSQIVWLGDSQWGEVIKMKEIKSLKKLSEGIESEIGLVGRDELTKSAVGASASSIDIQTMKCKTWKEWWDTENPEVSLPPIELTPLQTLCAIRTLRPDRLPQAIANFVATQLSPQYIIPPILDYDRLFYTSTNREPIIFILSPGADPTADLFALGAKHGFSGGKFKYLSLGQGQGRVAENVVSTGITHGQWVLLMNCHLLGNWLKRLENILNSFAPADIHKDFRLFLTTEPTEKFPLGLLQNSMKVVTEPPSGLRMNMLQTYARLNDDELGTVQPNTQLQGNQQGQGSAAQGSAAQPSMGTMAEQQQQELNKLSDKGNGEDSGKSSFNIKTMFSKLIYVLSFFHAAIQERRKYGKLGFNIPYDFNNSDFSVCFSLIKLYTDRTLDAIQSITKNNSFSVPPIPFTSLRYLIGEVMYGGRVTDDYDRRIVRVYLEEYMGDWLWEGDFAFYTPSDETTKKSKMDIIKNTKDRAGVRYNSFELPECGSYETCIEAISNLGNTEPPVKEEKAAGALSKRTLTKTKTSESTVGINSKGLNIADSPLPLGLSLCAQMQQTEREGRRMLEDLLSCEGIMTGTSTRNQAGKNTTEKGKRRAGRDSNDNSVSDFEYEDDKSGSNDIVDNSVNKNNSDMANYDESTMNIADTNAKDEYLLTTANDIIARLPEPFDLPAIKRTMEYPSPTDIVLLQELERFNMLLDVISLSLSSLRRALLGEIGMSQALDAVANSLYASKVPSEWLRHAPQTLKGLGSWVIHFLGRHSQYKQWVENGEPPCMWLSGLHIPESYLTALVQQCSRIRMWPLDRSTLTSKVTNIVEPENIKSRPEFGCYIHGLFLEGASWNGKLVRQRPKEILCKMPVVEIIPIEQQKIRNKGNYKCPVYLTSNRRDSMGNGLVFEAELDTDEDTSHWVLQGTALILNDS